LGVDVGGTFTDLLLFDGIEASEIDSFLHGTTVATNAILQGKGARVGLIVTEGYRQVLQVARSFVPGGLAGWIIWPKPAPLASLEDTVEVSGRMTARGDEYRPIDKDQARKAIASLKDSGVEAITICLMNSYANGEHENQISEIAREVFPDLTISLSHEILPEMYEYERTLTTVANSSVRPVVGRYIANLETELRGMNMAGHIHMLRSDGGLMTAAKAQDAPVNLLLSGPAGGVTGALWVANTAGFKNILTLDVGGTSTDVALIENGEPRLVRNTDVGHLKVRASSLDVKTVGAGGGSIAHVPELTKALRVGPESAGADPGPASYGMGGTSATVTDANVVLGYLPESLLGGEFKLDKEAAKTAVQEVADAMGIGLEEAAAGIIDIVNENMFGALRMISVQQGYDPRDFALMGFGGAGSLHSNAVARLMGSWPVIVPNSPGVLCALGDATTRIRAESARSHSKRVSETSAAAVQTIFAEMEQKVLQELMEEGVDKDEAEIRYEIDVRYHGQGYEIPMPYPTDGGDDAVTQLCAAFDEEHRRMFTFNMEAEHELVNLRVVALGRELSLPALDIEKGDGDPSAAKIEDHEVWIDGKSQPAVIYERSKLRAGDRIEGPAIVVEMDSTALILPKHIAEVDDFGNILINPA
jgi:N-methylhydantoinase A